MSIYNVVETNLKERLHNELEIEIEKMKEELMGGIALAAQTKDVRLINELNIQLAELYNLEANMSLTSDARLDRLKDVIKLEYNSENTSDRFTNTKVSEISFGPFTINLGQPELWVKGFRELMMKLYEINPEKYNNLAKQSEYKYVANDKDTLRKVCDEKYIDEYKGVYWNNKSNTIYKVKMMYDMVKQYGYNTINFKVVA